MIAAQTRRIASGAVLSMIGLVYPSGAAHGAAVGADWHPTPGMTWQWQLSGPVDTSVDAQVFDIDLFDTPEETIDALHFSDRRVVCHFSAGSYDVRRPDASSFPRRVRGDSLDPPYASERWLDIRDARVRRIMEARLDLAASKKCDGVEPDNLDAYENDSGFNLKARDQRAYNRFIAEEAHERHLAVGLKNNAKQVTALEPAFDFAVVEQCFEFEECKKFQAFVDGGKAVFAVEYDTEPAQFCPAAADLGFSAILKQLDIGAQREACPTGG